MADSLLIQKIVEISSSQDSINNSLQEINSGIKALKGEGTFYKLLPLIGVLVGGFITWWTQNKIKSKELSLALTKELREVNEKISTAIINLQFLLRELAYLEVDSKFQYYLYLTLEGPEKERAYEEVYTDYKYIAEVKTKIASAVSSLDSNFTAHFRLTKKQMSTEAINILRNFGAHIVNLPRPNVFDECIEVTSEHKQNCIDELVDEYTKYLREISKMADAFLIPQVNIQS